MEELSPAITRHFVNVSERRVHFHACGAGSPVAMMHASPRSAESMRTAQLVFGTGFQALAFDTPSFGLSDPLPQEAPDIEDYAVALAEALSALGIEQVAAYGRHTGAAIAVEFARAFPDRCSMGMTDGFPVYTAAERADRLAHYIPGMAPSWEGAHLLWTWFRFRDQFVFWPWHRQAEAQRSDSDIPDPDAIHRGVLDMLDAGDGVNKAYGAAFRYRGLDVLDDLKVPVCFGNRAGDLQYHTIGRYPARAWTVEVPREPQAGAAAELALLKLHPARRHDRPLPRPAPLKTRTTLDYVSIDGRQLLTRSAGDLKAQAPVVIVHPVPGSSAQCDELIWRIGRRLPALAIDLPGQGHSDPAAADITIPAWSAALDAALAHLGIAQCHVLGLGTGATVAVDLARLHPGRILSMTLQSPPYLAPEERKDLASRYAPETDVEWDGGHLARAFHHLRDQELWWPWFDRRPQTRRIGGHRIDPGELTFRLAEALRHPSNYAQAWRSALSYPLKETLAGLDVPFQLVGLEKDLFASHRSRIEQDFPTRQLLGHFDDGAGFTAQDLCGGLC